MPTLTTVPYQANPGNACALACYTMVAKYLLPNEDITYEKLGKIANWHPGYVVWGFRVWQWLMDREVYISDTDQIDYAAWARNGVEGLRRSVSVDEFAYYQNNTFDLADEGRQISLVFDHPHFYYTKKNITWTDVVAEFAKPGICDITLNSHYLNRTRGLAVHRVVIIDINPQEVVFHDPNRGGTGAYRRESTDHFRRSVESLGGAEVARYSLGDGVW